MNLSKKGLILFFILFSMVFTNETIGQCNYLQADKFDNVWVVNNGEVVCFDKQHKKVGSYSNILLGNPTIIDVLDPFRVMVYYQSAQTIILLNNRVTEISKPILLSEKGINDASAVCKSSKGGFWILDRTKWEILHFDQGFDPTGEKIMLDLSYSGSKPTFMQENSGILYVAFKEKAICRFDPFGARIGDIPVKIDNYFGFIDKIIVYQTEGLTYQYDVENNQILPFDLSIRCIPVKVQGQFLYFDGQTIIVYKIR